MACCRSLTWKAEGSSSKSTLLHTLAMEKPVAHHPNKLIQLRPRGIHQLCTCFTKNCSLDPKVSAHRCRNDQNTGKTKKTANWEDNFLLAIRHCALQTDSSKPQVQVRSRWLQCILTIRYSHLGFPESILAFLNHFLKSAKLQKQKLWNSSMCSWDVQIVQCIRLPRSFSAFTVSK